MLFDGSNQVILAWSFSIPITLFSKQVFQVVSQISLSTFPKQCYHVQLLISSNMNKSCQRSLMSISPCIDTWFKYCSESKQHIKTIKLLQIVSVSPLYWNPRVLVSTIFCGTNNPSHSLCSKCNIIFSSSKYKLVHFIGCLGWLWKEHYRCKEFPILSSSSTPRWYWYITLFY